MRKKKSSPCDPHFSRSYIFCEIFAPAMLKAIATTKAGNDKL